jgi:hypothetical protein
MAHRVVRLNSTIGQAVMLERLEEQRTCEDSVQDWDCDHPERFRKRKNNTLRLGGGWNPPVERWNGHAEVQGYVSGRHTVG